MKSNLKRYVLNVSIIASLVLGIAACDNELNTIGSDILGADQLNDRIQKQDFDVVAFNELIGPVQTNNFNSMPFGSYSDPVYGRTNYSFVSQLSLPTTNPDFGVNPILDSVVINIPYFSTITGIDGEDITYELDSVYGIDPIHLQIFENNYFLSDFDPQNIEDTSTFYSDLGATIDSQKGALIYENLSFKPSSNQVNLEIVDDAGEIQITDRLTPRLRRRLDNAFWQSKIVDQVGTPNLQSDNDFRNFFRGLYFKTNAVTVNGNYSHIDVNNATIELYLTTFIPDISDIDDDGDTTELNEIDTKFTLDFNGNRVNLIDDQLNNAGTIADIVAANDDVNGEENLYLKGGSGSIALIDLFGPDADMNGEADALTQIIENNWLINEASLTFYVDENISTEDSQEPERLILYDFDNNEVLLDFLLDSTAERLGHLGELIEIDDLVGGTQGHYKIIITNHVTSVINGETENSRLALAVVQNPNTILLGQALPVISNSKVKDSNEVEVIPSSTAISHEGTILHGNLSSDPEKRLKLEIYYTETN